MLTILCAQDPNSGHFNNVQRRVHNSDHILLQKLCLTWKLNYLKKKFDPTSGIAGRCPWPQQLSVRYSDSVCIEKSDKEYFCRISTFKIALLSTLKISLSPELKPSIRKVSDKHHFKWRR